MHVKYAAYDDEYDNGPVMTAEVRYDADDSYSTCENVAEATLKTLKESFAIVTETTTYDEGEVTRALHFSGPFTLFEDGMENLLAVIWKGAASQPPAWPTATRKRAIDIQKIGTSLLLVTCDEDVLQKIIAHPRVRKCHMDSVLYWVSVDKRYDLDEVIRDIEALATEP